ncbi:putative oxidoreductase [Trichonephila inaurata madagascariensis]|uniref:Putative oxidoreductase n=1 Tax=Trichonephila inaurata madagascariensis TaxID=2747483 RepID=A0A8X6XF08_9ARAC|nr:putative oxidoreductase [Trichonephila inaurata madagascariensis]
MLFIGDISAFIISKMPVTTSKGNFGPREVELSNYVKMPIFGLGTSHSGGYSQEAVVYALKNCNYRLIDTAKRYGCEEFLQSAIHSRYSSMRGREEKSLVWVVNEKQQRLHRVNALAIQ